MPSGGPKKAGKAEWAGRRRPMTRTSGFSARAAVEVDVVHIDGVLLDEGHEMVFTFHIPDSKEGERLGFGGWFYSSGDIETEVIGSPGRNVLTTNPSPDWNKVGSQWVAEADPTQHVELHLRARSDTTIAVFGLQCGIIEHEYLTTARPELLPNMWNYAPEGNFYVDARTGKVTLEADQNLARISDVAVLHLKSCNRCGRFLPVNVNNERAHLSFSNHCVADHRRPCQHSGFGRIREKDSDRIFDLEYGFQLECRFCKKFEVNAAHNPQRSTAQMKEDAQRRRSFELLMEHLYEGSDQLRYRHQTGGELADDIYARFDGRCFKCETPLSSPADMHLDHTRPLALLWPLDETATSLCGTCNSSKRDRPPIDFYSEDELRDLSDITGIPLDVLKDPSPNLEVLELLRTRATWFFEEFLQLPELQEVRDGKRTSELLLKALDKALQRTPGGAPFTMDDLRRDE
ncbi:hypothetical protein BMS3Bbin01_00364 [bacterium BMS3Bbin01]|nr:hypothetical protein BMS3Bbin01_00364 [bacterium BMS3Bbin01]